MNKNSMTRYFIAAASPILFCAVSIILWEVFIKYKIIDSYILPAPTSVLASMYSFKDVLIEHSIQTLLETIIGLCISVALGIAIAILIDSSSFARRIMYPLLVASQTVPIIALAPLLLIWFGFGLVPKVIVVVLYCFFPMSIAMVNGFASVSEELIMLLKSMGASKWQIMKLVKFPTSLPSFFSGLKIAVTYSITGAIVGEYVGSYQGLGVFIQTSANSHAIALVFAAIFVVVGLSLLLFSFVLYLERVCMPWKYHSRKIS